MQRSFLQSINWADFRASLDWGIQKFKDCYVLERKLPFGKSFIYAPEVSLKPKEIAKFRDEIRKIIPNRVIFFRSEILNEITPDYVAALETAGFGKAFEEVQPEHRQVIDLSPPLEEIFKAAKPKGRYNINLARRHGVRVLNSDKLENFYLLYQQAAKRDKFRGRSLEYFQSFLKFFPNEADVFTAYFQNQPLASALVIYWFDTASYLYGGSSNEHREVMASSLLHWKIIEQAKIRGMKYYDLLAIAPNDNLNHKFAGLRRFKQQFGGRQVDIVGSYDLILKPIWYMIFRFAEILRRK